MPTERRCPTPGCMYEGEEIAFVGSVYVGPDGAANPYPVGEGWIYLVKFGCSWCGNVVAITGHRSSGNGTCVGCKQPIYAIGTPMGSYQLNMDDEVECVGSELPS